VPPLLLGGPPAPAAATRSRTAGPRLPFRGRCAQMSVSCVVYPIQETCQKPIGATLSGARRHRVACSIGEGPPNGQSFRAVPRGGGRCSLSRRTGGVGSSEQQNSSQLIKPVAEKRRDSCRLPGPDVAICRDESRLRPLRARIMPRREPREILLHHGARGGSTGPRKVSSATGGRPAADRSRPGPGRHRGPARIPGKNELLPLTAARTMLNSWHNAKILA
jgi:hypothetical protein